MECHIYLNNELNLMVEVLQSKDRRTKPTYNLFQLGLGLRWNFVKVLPSEFEWHHKTWYPYNVDLRNFGLINRNGIPYETYKHVGESLVKVLNSRDGIEYIYDTDKQQTVSYISLQYQFQNISETFFDRRNGQFFTQETLLRL